jgi:hypothetical protein
MKVRDLIKELEQADPDDEVRVWHPKRDEETDEVHVNLFVGNVLICTTQFA